MGREDWYRNTSWSEDTKRSFFERLNRSRSVDSRSQYLRIQAGYLAEGVPQAAEELLSLLIEKYPNPTQLASAYEQLAELALARKDEAKAIEWFRKVMRQQEAVPNILTTAHHRFAVLVVMEKKTHLYGEVHELLLKYGRSDHFPIDSFLSNGCLGIIKWHMGEEVLAQNYCRKALESMRMTETQFRYHRKVGLVTSPEKKFVGMLERISKRNVH